MTGPFRLQSSELSRSFAGLVCPSHPFPALQEAHSESLAKANDAEFSEDEKEVEAVSDQESEDMDGGIGFKSNTNEKKRRKTAENTANAAGGENATVQNSKGGKRRRTLPLLLPVNLLQT